MRKINKKACTLIELLAVIIILGVLMLIAIPSVTEYISNSRKNTYITTANNYITSAIAKVNSMDYSFTDMNTMYYIPAKCINLEKGGKSPYGEWVKAYVVVTFNGNSYNYYWTSYDTANMGVALTKGNDLKKDDIKPNTTSIDMTLTKDNRVKTGVIPDDCSATPTIAYIPGNTAIGTLSSKVAIGDFVNYDAGNWDTTTAMPTSTTPFTFGGYTVGNSRNQSIVCGGAYGTAQYSGWRVLSKTIDTVTLIHAGQPECYYHYAAVDTANNSVQILTGNNVGTPVSSYPSTPRNWNMYVNPVYAVATTVFTKAMLDAWNGTVVNQGNTITNSLIKTNSYYWLGSPYWFGVPTNNNNLYYFNNSGAFQNGSDGSIIGIRPVVTLKTGIQTSGQGTDTFGNTAWKLTD